MGLTEPKGEVLKGLGEETGGASDKIVTRVTLPLHLKKTEAIELAILFLETLAECA